MGTMSMEGAAEMRESRVRGGTAMVWRGEGMSPEGAHEGAREEEEEAVRAEAAADGPSGCRGGKTDLEHDAAREEGGGSGGGGGGSACSGGGEGNWCVGGDGEVGEGVSDSGGGGGAAARRVGWKSGDGWTVFASNGWAGAPPSDTLRWGGSNTGEGLPLGESRTESSVAAPTRGPVTLRRGEAGKGGEETHAARREARSPAERKASEAERKAEVKSGDDEGRARCTEGAGWAGWAAGMEGAGPKGAAAWAGAGGAAVAGAALELVAASLWCGAQIVWWA
jgi:hypothetical protein